MANIRQPQIDLRCKGNGRLGRKDLLTSVPLKRRHSKSTSAYFGCRQDQLPGGFERKRDAEAALRDALGRVESGTWTAPLRMTLGEYLEQWLEGAASTRRPGTMALYRTVARSYIGSEIGDVKVTDLTPTRLERFYAHLLERGLKPASVRHAHSLIRRALGDAVRRDELARNVAALATPPRVVRSRMLTWDADELGRFLDHVRGDRLEAAWTLAATTGMRRGEVLGVRWRDVDLDGAALSVRSELILVDGRPQLVEWAKSDGSRRSIPLALDTVAALRIHRAAQGREHLKLGPDYYDLDLVFALPTGEPLHPTTFSRRFLDLARAAGLARIRFHDLRHTWATLALRAGVHPKVVQEILGHSTIALTLDLYSHTVPAMESDAVGRVADLIARRAEPE
jgi:integrase